MSPAQEKKAQRKTAVLRQELREVKKTINRLDNMKFAAGELIQRRIVRDLKINAAKMEYNIFEIEDGAAV